MSNRISHGAPRRSAISTAVLVALAATAAPTAVLAQESATLDRIEVTGSRIRQVDTETAQPVLTISRADIEKQGFQSVADILQNISAAGSPALSRASPLSSGELPGGSFISMRGIGAQRTLVLVNGKRLGISTNGFQDISTIPTAMVERIEVLKDGASSIYGSDAIGGVVNIITRSSYDGLQANAYFGQYSEGDGEVEKLDFMMGSVGERSSVTFGFEYAKENAVSAADREFSAYPQGALHPTRGWTVAGQYGGFVTTAARPVPGIPNGVRVILRPGGDPRNINDYVRQDVNTGAAGEGSPADKSNTNQQTDLRTPLTRKSVFVNGQFDIADNLRFRSDVAYTNREASRTVAGYPFQAASFNTPMSADSYFNPFAGTANAGAITNWWRRTWEVPRVSDSDLDVLRFTAALEGSFQIGERYFDWDINHLYSSNKLVQASYGNLNLAAVRNAVGPSFLNAQGRVQCGTAANPIPFGTTDGSCIPWNPFLAFGVTGQGALTGNQELMDYLFQEEHSTGKTSTQIFAANITGGLWTLPAGELGFAAGVERRKEKGEFVPDALAVTGGSTNLSARPTRGGYNVDDIYVEFAVPLLSGVTGAQELSLSLASRYSDYDTFGDTTNNKIGLTWRPIDSLLVRGTYADGFRAPTIANLYAGGSQTFSFFTDPCDPVFGTAQNDATTRARCQADIANYASFRQLAQGFTPAGGPNQQTPLAFFSGAGNPTLTPETSTSKTVGLVWSPQFVDGLNMSLDYWSLKIEDTIVADTPTQILNDCYVQGIASRCTLFTRDAAMGIVNSMTFGNRNAGYIDTDGFDFDLNYRFGTDFGNFVLNWQTTYVSKYEFKTTNDPNVLPQQNNSFTATPLTGTSHRIRSNANLNWSMGDFSATWGVRYYSGLKETCLNATLFPNECSNPTYRAANPSQSRPINELGANTFHDLQVSWNAPWNATIAVGANNVFKHLGQQMYTQPNANVSYNGEFDIGRFVYMKYQQRF